MKTTIEEINGKLFTVIWHTEKARLFSGDWRTLNCSAIVLYSPTNRSHHIATALPALPRHPKPEDAPLLYRYMAEGIEPKIRHRQYPDEYHLFVGVGLDGLIFDDGSEEGLLLEWHYAETTHAIDSETGEKVEVALHD